MKKWIVGLMLVAGVAVVASAGSLVEILDFWQELF